jgi:dTDP-4-dehydrorhamnose 3,5-epimerase-like enzyme
MLPVPTAHPVGDAPFASSDVERIGAPSYDTFRRRYLNRRQPVVIGGAMTHWPAMRLWNVDYIGRAIGDRPITPLIMNDGRMNLDLREGMQVEEMDFASYRRQVEGRDAPPYYLRLALEGPFVDLLSADYDVPVYCSRRIFMKRNLWLGRTGVATGLHYDMTHNLVAQVVGRRRIVLFAPSERRNLYPYPMRTLSWHHSPIDLDAPDLTRYPRFARARRYEVEIQRGEMLFIPQGWWHRFKTIENGIAVNFFWLTRRLAPAMALARAAWVLRGVRT